MERAVVVGAGPNGLSAAIVLAAAGARVVVHEAADRAGGAVRSEALTLDGFVHDVCSSVYPFGRASPFFRTLPLEAHGLRWVEGAFPCAHPFDDGTAAVLARSTRDTGASLDPVDRGAWARLFDPFVERAGALFVDALAPPHLPGWPGLYARLGLLGLRSARGLAEGAFAGPRGRALFAGLGAHALSPLSRAPTAAFALVLGVAAHARGWPVAEGGAERVTDALVGVLRSLGGEVRVGSRVRSLDGIEAPVLLDLVPRGVLAVAGDRLPDAYRAALGRYRYGPGVFKVDWALAGPIPWTAAECAAAVTVHLGGALEEMAASERAPHEGRVAERPFVILGQPSIADPTRAPPERQVAWAYCHVPHGWPGDATAAIEAQVERFAPGFRERILARHVLGPPGFERRNANLVGGDIASGATTLLQTFLRPVVRPVPYATPVRGLWICSAATPPGGAVHGMCGYHAARAALAAE